MRARPARRRAHSPDTCRWDTAVPRTLYRHLGRAPSLYRSTRNRAAAGGIVRRGRGALSRYRYCGLVIVRPVQFLALRQCAGRRLRRRTGYLLDFGGGSRAGRRPNGSRLRLGSVCGRTTSVWVGKRASNPTRSGCAPRTKVSRSALPMFLGNITRRTLRTSGAGRRGGSNATRHLPPFVSSS